MTDEELRDFLLGNDEVELTENLIIQLVADQKWSSVESLKEMAEMGCTWNIKRDSIVFPADFF
jgi:hypothetical protein